MVYDPSLAMTFKNSQGDVEIYIPENYEVLVKCSGGADSSILLYMLAKYRHECNPTIKFTIATSVNEYKPYQYIHAKKVADYVNSIYPMGDYKHVQGTNRGREYYIEDQEKLVWPLMEDYIDKHYMGVTCNPPVDVMKENNMYFKYHNARVLNRDLDSPDIAPVGENKISENNYKWNRPFARHDKRGVAEFYFRLGVLETLFPLTRSCEDEVTDFSKHCGHCWFCLERKWGYGELDPPVIV